MQSVYHPKRDAFVSAVTAFAIMMACNLMVAMVSREGLIKGVQSQMLSIVKTAAEMTDGDAHQTITNASQQGGAVYKSIQAPYRKILTANPKIRFIYTAVFFDGKVHFVTDTDLEAPAGVMEEYPDASPNFLATLRERVAHADDETYEDKWGTFLSAYAPIYNSKHEVVGAVGADILADDFHQRLFWMWLAFGAGALLSFGLSIGVYFVVLRMRVDHAKEQQLRTSRMALMHSFNEEMHVIASSLSAASEQISAMAGSISSTAEASTDQAEEAKNTIRGAGESACVSISFICDQLVSTANTLQNDVQGAQVATKDTVEQLRGMETASGHLIDAAGNISQIVTLISDVTEKIDLLALNATIEAARAGEAGKGFAVVAEEVKVLAQQTASATQKISLSIGDMQKATEVVVQSFAGIAERVERINEQAQHASTAIESQREMVQLIADDIGSVTLSAQTVEETVVSVAEIAQRTESETQQLYMAVSTLSKQNKELDRKVGAFLQKIEESSSEGAAA